MNTKVLWGTICTALVGGMFFMYEVGLLDTSSEDDSTDTIMMASATPPVVPAVSTQAVGTPPELVASSSQDVPLKDEVVPEKIVQKNIAPTTPVAPTPVPKESPPSAPIPTPVPPAPTPTPSGYTLTSIASHNSAASCWMAIRGKVYDVTRYIKKHPGGNAILRGCGEDATGEFEGIRGHLKQKTLDILPGYYLGPLSS
jgi:predicted heme/steroid binding protein